MDVADLARAAGVEEEKVVIYVARARACRRSRTRSASVPAISRWSAFSCRRPSSRCEGAELLRVIGASLARIADAAVALYVQNVEAPRSVRARPDGACTRPRPDNGVRDPDR